MARCLSLIKFKIFNYFLIILWLQQQSQDRLSHLYLLLQDPRDLHPKKCRLTPSLSACGTIFSHREAFDLILHLSDCA